MQRSTDEQRTLRNRRVLVSGGAGFIGSHLVDILLERGDHVTVVDDLSTGRRENIADAHPRLRFIEASLSDALNAFGRGEWFHEIYHLAAAVGVRLVLENPIKCIETNVEQTAAVLRFAAQSSSPEHKSSVLITSSSEVYGKPANDIFREDDDVLYGPTSVLRWSYAQTKAIDEYLALAHHARGGLQTVVVRLFNTVGPRQLGSYGMVLPRFVQAAMHNEPLQVYGDGTQTRCFCDVRDVAEALTLMVRSPACTGRVLNLGNDEPISMAELAQTVIETLHSSSEIRFVPYESAYSDGFEDLQRRRPCLDRIRAAIGFHPKLTLRQTIIDVAAHLERSATQMRHTQ